MAFDNPHGCRLVGNVTDVQTQKFPVLDTKTVRIGDVVKSVSLDGYVSPIANADDPNPGTLDMIGVALEYGLGTTSNTPEVLVCIDPKAKYVLQQETVGGGAAFAVTDVFKYFQAVVPTGSGTYSKMELEDVADATNGYFMAVGIVKGPSPGGGFLPTFGSENCEVIVVPRIVKWRFGT